MSRPARVPPSLRGRVFTTAEARDAGVTPSMLRGAHFASVRRGVWRLSSTPMTFELEVRAALACAPADAALSHLSALRWYGIELGRPLPLHLSTATSAQSEHDGVVLHRRLGRLTPRDVGGVPCLAPDRTFVDSGTLLGLRDLVRAGDALVRSGFTTVDRLLAYVSTSHLDGVVRAREAAVLVRERVDSVRETDVRLLLVLAGLPEPETNLEVRADDGTWLARGDLVLPEHRVVVEYDGWHHERDAEQRQADIYRRERLEAAGWTVIVVTVADLRTPTSVVARVHATLVRRGYTGPPPFLGRDWYRVARGS